MTKNRGLVGVSTNIDRDSRKDYSTSCFKCSKYNSKSALCRSYNVVVRSTSAGTCSRFRPKSNSKNGFPKKTNKGLQIRDKKREKRREKMSTKKESQIGLIRFVKFSYLKFEKINGKWRKPKRADAKGLQIENRVYLEDGKFKYVNNKGFKITKAYLDIPEWAGDNLISKYNKHKNQ